MVNEEQKEEEVKINAAAGDDGQSEGTDEEGGVGAVPNGSPCPEKQAGWFSRLTIAWLTPLFRLGSQRALQMEDTFLMSDGMKADPLGSSFDRIWSALKGTNSNWPLLWTLHYMFKLRLYSPGLLKLISDFALLGTPWMLQQIVENIKKLSALQMAHPPTEGYSSISMFWPIMLRGYAYCIGMFILQMTSSICLNAYIRKMAVVAISMRTCISPSIYQKSLRLSNHSRQIFSAGRVINLMTTDVNRVENALFFMHYLWSGPLQVSIAVWLLYRLIGWCSFVGVGIFFFFVIVQSKLMFKRGVYRKEVANISDQRVRLIKELIYGMRAIKFYLWDMPFVRRIEALRKLELACTCKVHVYKAITYAVTSSVPPCSCVVTFVVYYLMGNELSAEIIFPALACFNLLRIPLHLFPDVAALSIDAKVSLVRIQNFLLASELNFKPVQGCSQASNAIEASNATFDWDITDPEWEKRDMADIPDDTDATINFAVTKESEESQVNLLDRLINADSASSVPEVLQDISFSIPKGMLVGIVGPVGSGKTSLLSALLGEMRHLGGNVRMDGSISLCPQQAWLRNATIRQNILFGQPYNASRYETVIRACSLSDDLAVLPNGDATEVGEKGASLSGGQKQRINLARAAYANTDIIILDDPLAAIDSRVSRRIFDECICTLLQGKTRLLATHAVHLMKRVDYILVLSRGRIVEAGTYPELMAADRYFCDLVTRFGSQVSEIGDSIILNSQSKDDIGVFGEDGIVHPNAGASNAADDDVDERRAAARRLIRQQHDPFASRSFSTSPPKNTSTSMLTSSPRPSAASHKIAAASSTVYFEEIDETMDNMGINREVQKPLTATLLEDRQTGAVSSSVYKNYIKSAGGLRFVLPALLTAVLVQAARVGCDAWLSLWVSSSALVNNGGKAIYSDQTFIGVYLSLGVVQGFLALFNGLVFAYACTRASFWLHSQALLGVVHAPMWFFDQTPAGRLIARFSNDQDTVDSLLPESLWSMLVTTCMLISAFALIGSIAWSFLITLIPLGIFYFYLQRFYRATSRELQRLDILARSPLYSHMSETLTGPSIIRAFKEEAHFSAVNVSLLDNVNRPRFLLSYAKVWVGVRLEMIGSLVVLFASLCCYALGVPAAAAGLAIGYALNVTGTLNWAFRQLADVETRIISAERLAFYADNLPAEPAQINESYRPPPEWPTAGAIEFKNVTLKYRPDLPPALTNVSLEIKPCEKIGIVGRTGAGKSSVMMALFRLVDLCEGSILIDGIDIRNVGLKDLRNRLAIIPQDPAIFEGTIRSNLDPCGEIEDAQLWEALDGAHMRTTVASMDGMLDAAVQEGGDNFSLGQRQLLCLARALLQDSRIVVMDEATASIDLATESLIQACLDRCFANATLLTIAHRLDTILSYDRILVLGSGRVEEFGTPAELLANPNSTLSALLEEARHNVATP